MFGRRPKTFKSSPLSAVLQAELNSTQEKIKGSDLISRQASHAVLIGAGGIGATVAAAFARIGIGKMTIIDHDIVELPNLTRQAPFTKRDIGKGKPTQLARHLTRDAMFPLTIMAHPFRFQELIERNHDFGDTTFFVCGPDNNATRQAVARFAYDHHLPAITAAIGRDSCQLNVFIQEPGRACWACCFPAQLDDRSHPCGLGATIDPLLLVAGLITYAGDTLISNRPRSWNFRHIFLDGSLPDRTRSIERNSDCPICRPLRLTTLPPPLPPLIQETAE